MLHLTQSKPHFSRTKLFQIASTRNKPVTSKVIRASAQVLTQTDSIARNRNARRTNDSAIRVARMSHHCNTPRIQNLNIPEQNIQSAPRQGCSNATPKFYFPSEHHGPIASSLSPVHVRVFSEYSDIGNAAILDFPARNPRFEACERKSTRTSFLNSCDFVDQAFSLAKVRPHLRHRSQSHDVKPTEAS